MRVRNEEYEMRSATSSTAGGLPSSQREGLKTEVPEIVSAQVIFPNRKTADEIVGELWEKVDALQAEVDALKKKIEGTEE